MIEERIVPDGFQLEWNEDIWNVGFVFKWSPILNQFIRPAGLDGRITVRPKDALPEAYFRVYNEWPDKNTEIFFVDEG